MPSSRSFTVGAGGQKRRQRFHLLVECRAGIADVASKRSVRKSASERLPLSSTDAAVHLRFRQLSQPVERPEKAAAVSFGSKREVILAALSGFSAALGVGQPVPPPVLSKPVARGAVSSGLN